MSIIKTILRELARLSNAVTAAAVVALAVQLLPGVNFDGAAVAGVLTAIGVIAAFLRKQFPALD